MLFTSFFDLDVGFIPKRTYKWESRHLGKSIIFTSLYDASKNSLVFFNSFLGTIQELMLWFSFSGSWVPLIPHLLFQVGIWWRIKTTSLKWELSHSWATKIQLVHHRLNQRHASSFTRWQTRHHAGKRFAWLDIHLHELRLVLECLSLEFLGAEPYLCLLTDPKIFFLLHGVGVVPC